MTSSFFPPASESDGARYELGRVLGTGSAGTVYLAIDRDTGEQVALKKLLRFDTKSVMRLKREFRSLANMHHPNLVKLYDLGRSSDGWFLTMEYVCGVDLLAHLGVSGDPLATNSVYKPPPMEAILHTFHQLARGVHALHLAKLLHRDLKPSNVLVSNGRVVALDFGLACELEGDDRMVSHDGTVAGTPAYMPPEQALGQSLSEVSDWYAVGAMLYQVLSGRLPIDGRNANELLRRKIDHDPVALSRLDPRLPARLSELCMRLLARDPAARPQGDEVLAVLADSAPDQLQIELQSMQTELGLRSESQQIRAGAQRLFGRDEALAALQDGLDQAGRGQPVVMHVRGASGAGKTALVECFLSRVAAESGGFGFVETLVLRSRCYEREAMPFKALDGVIDALVRYLSQLDDIDVAHILPEYVAELAQLFPALDRLRAVQRLSAGTRPRGDATQARQRAELALRELFVRLASRRTLVLWIDDLQWGDLDSARLLESWLPSVRDACMMFVFSYRSEELQTSSCLQLLLESAQRQSEPALTRVIELSPLRDVDMAQLCETRLHGLGEGSRDLVRRIVQEARGNPFLALQLTALAEARQKQPEAMPQLMSMSALVAESTALLAPAAREILSVLAVAGRPLSTAIALRTAGVSRDGSAHLHALKTLRLIRSREVTGERRVEVYHDRVRESVHNALPEAERVRLYDRLLREVEVSGQMDVDWMHSLALAAGQRVPALRYGLIAAERASATLAFERAAELYQVCLHLSEPDNVSGELWYKLALALARCRRGKQAAHAYLAAAERSSAAEALPMIRLAAMHLLRSGDFERGEALVDRVLAVHDQSVPASDGHLIAAIAWERGRLALRAGRYTARVEAAVPAELRERVELFATLTVDTIAYDPLRAALFQARCMRLAQQAGDPTSVTRALCLSATMACVSGTERAAQRSAALLREAEMLCTPLSSPRLLRFVHVARAVCAALLGQPRNVLDPAGEALRSYKGDSRGDEHGEYYHYFAAITARISALLALGEYTHFVSELRECVDRSRVTENHSMLLHVTVHQTFAEQALGHSSQARARLEAERPTLPTKRFGVLHVMHMCAVMLAASATGAYAWAHELVDAFWPRYLSSVVRRSAYLGIIAHSEHARMLIHERVASGDVRDLPRLVESDLDALEKSALKRVASGPVQVLRGRLAYLQGQLDSAVQMWRQSVEIFDELGQRGDAALLRCALSRVLGGEEGQSLGRLAEAQMLQCGIARPLEFFAQRFPELATSNTSKTS